MRLSCAPLASLSPAGAGELQIVLYGRADRGGRGEAGASLLETLRRSKLDPADRAWDLLSIALAVIVADLSVHRALSPDGWTRELDLHVAVADPDFWRGQKCLIEQQLQFLTTDRWRISFMGDGLLPALPKSVIEPCEDSVVLLSGGIDSLVGALDLVDQNHKPFAVSQVTWGDKSTQSEFARTIGGGLRHLQLNHNAKGPAFRERSQRARSVLFLAYGVLVATALKRYHEGAEVTLYVPENGFISINPPLTTARLGGLSTRTTHPVFLELFQRLLVAAGLRVRIHNPYQFKTKGEMLSDCINQPVLRQHAYRATSCSRYRRYHYSHCGRCVPCIVRRASFHTWNWKDGTPYRFGNLSRDDSSHAHFDDVRSVAMAVAQVRADGLESWLGTTLSSTLIGGVTPYRETVERGVQEIGAFLDAIGVT